MMDLRFEQQWASGGAQEPELNSTMANLALHIGPHCLTQNEDTWSKTVKDTVVVSAYPLAMWLASSWWRLNHEPLPAQGTQPNMGWRMAHELAAAGQGYVWPQVVLAADGEDITVWARPSLQANQQSVRYLQGLELPATVPLHGFRRAVDHFIQATISRLEAMGHAESDLSGLWQLVQEDRNQPLHAQYRRIEAAMGYDPDECPEDIMARALQINSWMGDDAFAELAPVYGNGKAQARLADIEPWVGGVGLVGRPTAPLHLSRSVAHRFPWQRGVDAARALRKQLAPASAELGNTQLYDLLGLTAAQVDSWAPPARAQATLAVPQGGGAFKYLPRKRHPQAKRFEYARMLGDHVLGTSDAWMASTDFSTARQKAQRAFAAEFLCPIDGLIEFLNEDFSESSLSEAAEHFDVSSNTVFSLLANNGHIDRAYSGDASDHRLPYRMAA
jgi:hypothetical protein